MIGRHIIPPRRSSGSREPIAASRPRRKVIALEFRRTELELNHGKTGEDYFAILVALTSLAERHSAPGPQDERRIT
jgi:hypothetical protein